MCEAVRWWSMLIAWGRDRADYQQLLEVISHDHARFMMRHTEVMN